MSRSKNYYAVVDKKTGKLAYMQGVQPPIFWHIVPARKERMKGEIIVAIPADRLNAFIQQYIPVPKVDQEPGN